MKGRFFAVAVFCDDGSPCPLTVARCHLTWAEAVTWTRTFNRLNRDRVALIAVHPIPPILAKTMSYS